MSDNLNFIQLNGFYNNTMTTLFNLKIYVIKGWNLRNEKEKNE